MSVSRAKSARKGADRQARASRKFKQHVTPVAGTRPSGDLLKGIARFRSALDVLGSALQGAPPLDYDAESRNPFPFNSIASSDAVQEAVLNIVSRREPTTKKWIDVFRALQSTADAGFFFDLYRDATFMAGAEYARRSLPSAWQALASLPDEQRRGMESIIRATVGAMADDPKGGAR